MPLYEQDEGEVQPQRVTSSRVAGSSVPQDAKLRSIPPAGHATLHALQPIAANSVMPHGRVASEHLRGAETFFGAAEQAHRPLRAYGVPFGRVLPAHPTSALSDLWQSKIVTRRVPAFGRNPRSLGPRPFDHQTSVTRVPPKVTQERQPHQWSLSHPRGPRYTNAQLKKFGATPDEIWIIDHESSGYAWAWNPILTPTGYAYGLGQVTGLFRLQHFGSKWESADPRVQIKMMKLYIRIGSSHFHTDAGAKAFWEKNRWY